MADPDTPKKKLSPGAWEEARALVWAHRNRLMLGLVLMIINRLAGLVLPSTSKWLMDDVVGKQHGDLLPMPALGAGVATLVASSPSSLPSPILRLACQRPL